MATKYCAMSSSIMVFSLGWEPGAQLCALHLHLIVVADSKNRQQGRTFYFNSSRFIAIPQAAWRENGVPVPATPGRAPSHTKHGPPESALACGTDPPGPSAPGDSGRGARVPTSHR